MAWDRGSMDAATTHRALHSRPSNPRRELVRAVGRDIALPADHVFFMLDA